MRLPIDVLRNPLQKWVKEATMWCRVKQKLRIAKLSFVLGRILAGTKLMDTIDRLNGKTNNCIASLSIFGWRRICMQAVWCGICSLVWLYGSLSASEENLVVPLSTGIQLVPVYVAPFKNLSHIQEESYFKKLEGVLLFDLENNGMTAVTSEKQRAKYIVTIEVSKQQLMTSLTSVIGKWTKDSPPLALTGDFSQDRKQIHLVADRLHKALFGKEGIARTKILYTLRQKIPGEREWTSEIWEADYDGGNARRVIENAGYCVTPQYAPAAVGKHPGSLLFVSYQKGQPRIYLGSLLEGKHTRLSSLRGNQLMPTLSYQRDQLAFISDVTGNPDLFVQSFDPEKGLVGKPRQIFSAPLATQGTPTFSPDGKRLAFVSDKDGSARIYAIDIPSENAKQKDIHPEVITKFRRDCTAPAWSPDGRKIAYCTRIDGIRQICVYDFATKQETQLSQGPLHKENPSWAPNSLHLIYNAGKDSTSELYLIHLNNPQPLKISAGAGEKRFPHWEPLP